MACIVQSICQCLHSLSHPADKSTPVTITASGSGASKTASEDLLEPPDSPPAVAEFASDAFNSELDQEDLQKGMEQLGMDKKDSTAGG